MGDPRPTSRPAPRNPHRRHHQHHSPRPRHHQNTTRSAAIGFAPPQRAQPAAQKPLPGPRHRRGLTRRDCPVPSVTASTPTALIRTPVASLPALHHPTDRRGHRQDRAPLRVARCRERFEFVSVMQVAAESTSLSIGLGAAPRCWNRHVVDTTLWPPALLKGLLTSEGPD